MSHKLSVPKTLLKRADTLITQEEDIRKEEETVKEALLKDLRLSRLVEKEKE